MNNYKWFSWLLAIILGALCAASVSFPWVTPEDIDAKALVLSALEKIDKHYVTPMNREELAQKAIQSLTRDLDMWSTYFPPDDFASFDEELEGQFGGIGVFFKVIETGLLVKTVLPGGPADKAGIRPEDLIIQVDGEDTAKIDIDLIKRRIRGVVGEPVILTIRTGQHPPRPISVIRAVIKDPSVYQVALVSKKPLVGIIRIERFQEDTAQKITKALIQLTGAGIQGLILDLRQNPGGLYSEALAVADLFLSEGVIVKTKGRKPTDQTTVYATRSTHPGALPRMVILLDEETASAAELVSGALREHNRAVLVGAPSYGKFCVQTIYELFGRGRRFGALKLTTKQYMTPNGSSLLSGKIQPDVPVAMTDAQKIAMVQQWRDNLQAHWGHSTTLQENPIDISNDPCLQKAVDILRAPQEYEAALTAKKEQPE